MSTHAKSSLKAFCFLIAISTLAAAPSWAGSEKTLYQFAGGQDGDAPFASLIEASSDSFYGTTAGGGGGSGCNDGNNGCGTVFKLGSNGSETVLHAFAGGCDGAFPRAALLADSAANFYGTTGSGGICNNANGYGTVFKLAADGTESVLYAFQGASDGSVPTGPLIADASGNLYGTTEAGGAVGQCELGDGCGIVFKLAPAGKKTTLYTFCTQTNCTDGADPKAGLISDSADNHYGTTSEGGSCPSYTSGCGTVFRLAPDGTETVLYTFQGGSDGGGPLGNLIADAAGNFYGTTIGGGIFSYCSSGCGTVFKLAPDGTLTTLYAFKGGSDGYYPMSGLVMDKNGNLYGTTVYGGKRACGKSLSCGTVFEVTPAGVEKVLYAFKGSHGIFPYAGLLLGKHGELYGTTSEGGSVANCPGSQKQTGCGVVFEVKK